MNPYSETPQLVNFCRVPLTKSLECSSVCADDYQLENLISQHLFQRLKGFRVEHFIRPPVHLDFHFLAPVNIACVVVKPDLTESSEINLTAFASSDTTCSAALHQMTLCSRGSVRGEGAVLVMKNRVFQRRHRCKVDLPSFVQVLGSCVSHPDIVAVTSEEPFRDVCNVRHLKLSINYFSGPRPVSLKWVEVWGTLGTSKRREDMLAAQMAIGHLNVSETKLASVAVNGQSPAGGGGRTQQTVPPQPTPKPQMHHYGDVKVSIVSSTSGIEVVKTCRHARDSEHPTPTAIGKGQHWSGPPSPRACHQLSHGTEGAVPVSTDIRSCGSTQEETLMKDGILDKLGTQTLPSYATRVQASSDGGGDGALRQTCTGRKNIGDTTFIPDRFLDEITCEVMTLPMLLPSGHFVDRSTLDKLHHTDSTYGRPPSDPFTGVAFSEHALPQFNVQLKQQIDSFLSRHRASLHRDELTSTFGQTLGSATEIAVHLKSSGAGKKRKTGEAVPYMEEADLPATKKQTLTTKTRGKGPSKRQRAAVSEAGPSLHDNLPTPKAVEAGRDQMCLHAHEQELTESLDRELHDLLQSK